MSLTGRIFLLSASVALATYVMIGYALSHSWYDPWCCNNQDCTPVKPEEMRVDAAGYHVRGFFIPHGDERIRLSQDWDYHLCEYPVGQVRCFYVPPGGS